MRNNPGYGLLARAVRGQMSVARLDCQIVADFRVSPPERSDNQPTCHGGMQ